jgi:hypothetical protein
MSAVRTWIVNDLMAYFNAPGTVWSTIDAKKFYELTGQTQAELMIKWHGQIVDPATGARDGKGTDPRFTTCTSFLPRYASRVFDAGGLKRKNLGPFTMNHEPAWVDNAGDASPQAGDFFLLGVPTAIEHTGIILEIDNRQWGLVAGGAGGPRQDKDGVKRTALEPIPARVMGWLDVDQYFKGWVKKP